MRRLILFIVTAIAVAQLSGCVVTDRTAKGPRPKVEKSQRKATKEKKNGKKTTTKKKKTDANTGASRRM